jgi:hypothetical protein
MSDKETKQSQKQAASTDGGNVENADSGREQVQSQFDEANEKGYFGVTSDPTPDENYTLRGNDLPTPETDDKLAEEVFAHQRKLAREGGL